MLLFGRGKRDGTTKKVNNPSSPLFSDFPFSYKGVFPSPTLPPHKSKSGKWISWIKAELEMILKEDIPNFPVSI